MTVVIAQMFAIVSLILFTGIAWILTSRELQSLDKEEVFLWEIRARRVGAVKGSFRRKLMKRYRMTDTIFWGENVYFIGNRFKDEIYVDDSGERILLYSNVQKERVYLTVLQGSIHISNHLYKADKMKRIEIKNQMKVSFSDVELEFIRKGGGY